MARDRFQDIPGSGIEVYKVDFERGVERGTKELEVARARDRQVYVEGEPGDVAAGEGPEENDAFEVRVDTPEFPYEPIDFAMRLLDACPECGSMARPSAAIAGVHARCELADHCSVGLR